MDLDSGVTVRLGRREVERIERFIRTASQVISHRLTEIAYVDMRYSNASPSAGAIHPYRVRAVQTQRRRRRLKVAKICSSVPIEIC
jgi:hypothetical protein